MDLGYVVYPENGNTHQGWALMNGVPALINLDDVTMLPKSAMEKDAQYVALRQSHPHLQLVVNDEQRKADASPQIERLPGEGEQIRSSLLSAGILCRLHSPGASHLWI